MSDNHQAIEKIMQAVGQAAESSNFDDELSKIMETFELIQERLLNSCLEILRHLDVSALTMAMTGLLMKSWIYPTYRRLSDD